MEELPYVLARRTHTNAGEKPAAKIKKPGLKNLFY